MSIARQETSADRLARVLAERNNVGSTNNYGLAKLLNLPAIGFLGMFGLIGCAFFNLVDLSSAGSEKVSFDIQVLAKLGLLGMLGAYGVLGLFTHASVRRILFSFPMFWVVGIFALFVVSVPSSITPKESLASTLSIVCVLLGTTRAVTDFGLQAIIKVLFFAASLFVVVSWFLFLLVPRIGVFQEPISDGQFVARMSGLAHPNTLGQFSGLAIVLGLILYKFYGKASRWWFVLIALAMAALLASVSRSSLVATVGAVLFLYASSIVSRRGIASLLVVGLVGMAGLIFLCFTTEVGLLLESKIAGLSRSGDAEELVTATGRLEIWAYAVRLISNQPLTGYGAATSKWFLSDYSLYTHNMILNVAFSTGIFGGIACVCMLIGRVFAVFRSEHLITASLIVFVVVNGVFEDLIFSILCGLPTIVWIVALAEPSLASSGDASKECKVDLNNQLLGVSL